MKSQRIIHAHVQFFFSYWHSWFVSLVLSVHRKRHFPVLSLHIMITSVLQRFCQILHLLDNVCSVYIYHVCWHQFQKDSILQYGLNVEYCGIFVRLICSINIEQRQYIYRRREVGSLYYWKFWKAPIKFPQSCLEANKNHQQQKLSQHIIVGELLQTCGHFPLLTAPHLSGAPRAQHNTPTGVLEGQSRVGETPFLTGWPCSFWCSLGCDWLSVLKAHITSSFLIHQYPQVLLHWAVFNPFIP